MSDRASAAAGLTVLGALALTLLAVNLGGSLLSRPDEDPFPHREHRGLFPSCLACHAGVPQGDEARTYTVTAEQCGRCHDGRELERVEWSPPGPRPHNLEFTHPTHAGAVERAGEEPLSCESCHGIDPAGPRMAVDAATAENCLGCHAHRSPDHLATDSECATCHVPLVEASSLPTTRVAGFPVPDDHAAEDFLSTHGEDARSRTESCAVCHARESCTSCHLNADRIESIRALPADSRIADLVRSRQAEWPEPASHGPSWVRAHAGPAVDDPESCTNCHARSSCTTCHTGDEPVVNRMPVPGPDEPAGARTSRLRPPGHGTDFTLTHGAAAAASLPRCESCHREETCSGCHASSGGAADAGGTAGELGRWPPAPTEGGYHPPNFIQRHGAEAFAARTECAECHSREAFCRSCHEQVGVAREGRLGSSSFHDAIPNWLLGHGQAARRNLESCASCHQQTSCLRCHSARSGWRISPHGPGFDPERISDRSAISCAVCHRSLPRGEGG